MLSLLHSFSAASALFLAFLLAMHPAKANRLANFWLALFLFSIGIMLMDDCLGVYRLYYSYPHLYGVSAPVLFLLAPSLYLSVSFFVAIKPVFKAPMLWHLVIPMLWTWLNFPFFIQSGDFKIKTYEIELLEFNSTPDSLTEIIILSVLFFQVIFYWAKSMHLIRRHRKNVREIMANTEAVELSWLYYFLMAIGAMIIFWILDIWAFPVKETEVTILSPGYFMALYFLGYFVLRQREIYPFPEETRSEINQLFEEVDDSAKKKMFSDQTLDVLKKRLSNMMNDEKPYLINELTLPLLAEKIGIGTHELSHLINHGFGENFNNYINRFRVEASKEMLKSSRYQHWTLLAIGAESGFNSRTAFHTAFKKATGISPSEFREKAHQGSVSST